MNLSFAGCGFLGIYHVGVVSCFKEYAPNLVKQFAGASAGALAACSILCDLSIGQMAHDTLDVSVMARNYRMGAFNPKFDVNQILTERLTNILPKDAYLRCRGRLHISVTRVSDGKNVIINQYDSNEELIQALICSSFIPLFSGIIPPSYRGIRYIDGCYSDNLPILDSNTITVSPFGGGCDICPKGSDQNWFMMNLANTSIELSAENLNRFLRVLFPSHPEVLSKMCQQGFSDAFSFLQKKNLLRCAKCLSNTSPILISGNSKEESEGSATNFDLENNCKDCDLKKEGHVVRLPEAVMKVLQDVCESMNRGFINWIYSFRPVKLLSAISLPCLLSFDIAYVALLKLFDLSPKFKMDFNNIIAGLLNYVQSVFKKINESRNFYSAKITCQLALTEISCETKSIQNIEPKNCAQIIEGSALNSNEAAGYERIMSRMDFDIAVNINASNNQQTDLSWRNDNRGCDEFDIVEVMRCHDALLSRYYLNERQSTNENNVETTSKSEISKTSGNHPTYQMETKFSSARSISLNIEH